MSALLFTAAEVAQARTDATLAMPDSCAIQRATRTRDGAGGSTTATAILATVPCRLRPAGGGDERTIADALQWVVAYTVSLPWGTDLRPTDTLLIAGRTFQVGGVLQGGAYSKDYRAVCKEIG